MGRRKTCNCGQPLPRGRRRHCSDQCARAAWRAAEKATKPAREPAGVPIGAVKGQPGGYQRVYLPDHPLARRGWVGVNRAKAYDERHGVAACDATGEPGDWGRLRVVGVDGRLLVVCGFHGRVLAFGRWAEGISDPDPVLLEQLNGLMARGCHDLTIGEGTHPESPLSLSESGDMGVLSPASRGEVPPPGGGVMTAMAGLAQEPDR